MCFGVVRGEASVSRKKSFSQTHTHTHTHHKISLFLSVTHSGKLDLHLQPLAHQGPPCPCLSGGVREGIRFPKFFFHISHFFFLEGITIAKIGRIGGASLERTGLLTRATRCSRGSCVGGGRENGSRWKRYINRAPLWYFPSATVSWGADCAEKKKKKEFENPIFWRGIASRVVFPSYAG